MSLNANVASIPPEVVASWPTPNYTDPVRRTWMPAFILVWQITSTVLVGGRFYLRGRRKAGSFGWDDLLIAIAWALSVAESVCIWIDTEKYGLDRHGWDIQPKWLAAIALNGWLIQLFFVVSTVCTKISVLLFYRRMVNHTLDKRWIWALRSALAFTAAYGIAITVTYLCTCIPLEAAWEMFSSTYTKEYSCIKHGGALAVIAGALSVVSDVAAVALPWAMLSHYNLDASRRQKLALYATFALGLLVSGAGCARAYYLWKIQHSYDLAWTGFDLLAWALVETQLAIICACAPALRVFFRRYLRDPIKRGFTNYNGASKQPTLSSTHLSSSRPQRDSRNFHELRELESGIHGVAYPAPVIKRESEEVERARTPPITNAEEYTRYAVERVSRQGSFLVRPNPTKLSPPASCAEDSAMEAYDNNHRSNDNVR
ncbi:Hypothetical predicted protein [Lecanosticta acicola]|uniref:Rhodopsin domain-containing protein n=1 Tax=Lecanosticta acicola TaxID=111012 RepID=A0AAI8YWZ6_9PEZI|nr:Hypothetical predicted protein [Lecanosticta acicola]